jgi:hypothetical protein
VPERYREATQSLIEADSGGSTGARSRVWKHPLQVQLADAVGVSRTVCHSPTGRSKWTPIEHRLFRQMSQTWAGGRLRSFAWVQRYIADTTTQPGLPGRAHRVPSTYALGVRVSDAEMATLNSHSHPGCRQWNYTISPRLK